ncbi:MAG: GMC oxidoreductase, partial [Pseudolysinimonas sp.]
IEAQRQSEGLRPHTTLSGARAYSDPTSRAVRSGTQVLPDGYQQPGEDGIPGLAMSTNVGGMGAHWTCACPRPGGAERALPRPDLDELLDEGERLLGVDRHPFDDAPFADVVRERLAAEFDADRPAAQHVRAMPLAVHRRSDGALEWSGSDVVFGEVTRANSRFELVPEAQVRRVLIDDGQVTGVVVRDRRSDEEHVVRARFVVVAADAVRTPQLLFASGVRPDALGRYLNDQPQLLLAARLHNVPDAPVAEPDDTAIVAQGGVSWVPYTDAEPFHGQVMQLDASPVPLADNDVPSPGSIVGLGWFCAKDLQASDRLAFEDGVDDEYGMPKPEVHYVLTERDHASMAAARVAIVRAARSLGEPLGGEPFALVSGASLHYQGTVRMGASDDGTSVCDPDSQVWGVDGLYVAGNGVISTAIACNPTLTSVAIAVAGARAIADRLSVGATMPVDATSHP